MPIIIKPKFKFEEKPSKKILKKLERIGRTCYKSEDRITPDSATKFIDMIVHQKKHESIIEHSSVTVRIICDRGVTHEIVRHRIGSYSQESTRYCNYKTKGVKVIKPMFFSTNSDRKTVPVINGWNFEHGQITPTFGTAELNEFDIWFMAMIFTEWAYNTLVDKNLFARKPEEARSVLPNSLKTEIVVTYNLREWRHFFQMRTSKAAHPQMHEITIPMLAEFKKLIPVIFDDINPEI